MSQKKTYKHSITDKVGEFSEAVAALYPELVLVDVPAEPVVVVEETDPEAPETEPTSGKHAAPNRKKVAA